jgi:hypothetical protein
VHGFVESRAVQKQRSILKREPDARAEDIVERACRMDLALKHQGPRPLKVDVRRLCLNQLIAGRKPTIDNGVVGPFGSKFDDGPVPIE